MRLLTIGFILLSLSSSSWGRPKKEGVLNESSQGEYVDSFYDPKADYSHFNLRVTDRDTSGMILKARSEQKNIKFFKSGDLVEFRFHNKKGGFCQARIRGVEKDYIVLYVVDWYACKEQSHYFRRGALMQGRSLKLAERVREAAQVRLVLIKRRRSFLRQLNDVNHFLWSHNQERLDIASKYDEEIQALEKAKDRAIEMLQNRKKDSINLQQELNFRLDHLAKEIDYYRIETHDRGFDRFSKDHHLGIPVATRPPKMKYKD